MLEPDRIYLHDHRSEPDSGGFPPESGPGPIDKIAKVMSRQLGVYLAAGQAAMADRLGLSVTELKALEMVLEFEALPTGQLGQLMGISWGGTTALINRLEAAGYVRRGRHPLDRRVIVIRPVAERCAELARERQAMADEVTFIGRQFDPEQLQVVQAFLRQYVRALRHETTAWLRARQGFELDR